MNRPINSYRDLNVWQKAIALSVACYRTTSSFPRQEIYGMTNQISSCRNLHGREYRRGPWPRAH
jgi:hypothetical protein